MCHLKMLKRYIQKKLEKLAKKYLKKHQPKLVVVVGSVGKTSTKMAIAAVLSEQFRVRVHDGNHNTHMSVPLSILGVEYPEDIRSIGAWRQVFKAAKLRIKQPKDVDIIVQELGTDRPGDIAHFGKYLSPDVAVVTAVSPEHMEFFETIDAVAKEELAVASFSQLTVINRDDIASQFADHAQTSNLNTYGLSQQAEYRFEISQNSQAGLRGNFISPENGVVAVDLKLASEQGAKAATAAGLVAIKLGVSKDKIKSGLEKIRPAKGRMNILRGVQGSTLIDDTYNSSPLAVEAALKTLYAMQASQKIAILGSMNELGETSIQAHEQVGKLCDSSQLAWVITIGDDAEEYLAPAAKANGCPVKSFKTPLEAGAFVHKMLERGAVVLAKGSQNGVFAEEALKILLRSSEDERELVRQTPEWLEIKRKQFAGAE